LIAFNRGGVYELNNSQHPRGAPRFEFAGVLEHGRSKLFVIVVGTGRDQSSAPYRDNGTVRRLFDQLFSSIHSFELSR
jgi:hypothetical protein